MLKTQSKQRESCVSRQAAQPGAVDKYVGARMRVRRSVLGISQERLGKAVGLTFQQVQKYERGINRISAGRLLELSRILEVDVSYFFEGLRDKNASPTPSLCEEGERYEHDPLERRETYDLIRAYYRINDPQLRSRFLDLLKGLVATEDSKRKETIPLFREKAAS
ncbi:MAG: helix-turn-helix domain-containing protein [Holosporales bacterium]|jgi:transcriptional regulator with XRE-family HTH domain|nr:helix-turn-helix domain-containing protein [Holosporales bacterium]